MSKAKISTSDLLIRCAQSKVRVDKEWSDFKEALHTSDSAYNANIDISLDNLRKLGYQVPTKY